MRRLNNDHVRVNYELTEMTLRHHRELHPCGDASQHVPLPAIAYVFLDSRSLAVDLIYNPTETQLLSKARNKLQDMLNGLDMLQLQAQKSWEISWPRGCSDWGKQLI